MSILETPRAYFKGDVSWDPIVTNNTSDFYDEATAEPVFPNVANKVAAFRGEAVAAVTTDSGNWNPHGTHRAVFSNTAVCGVDVGNGVESTDPFVAAAVQFTGMLVDLEPYGSFSSQLFFDELRFGAGGKYAISAPRTSRVTARYINFFRNSANRMIAGVASAVWQCSFAKADGLRIEAADSPVLQALAAALSNDDVLGLTARFNTYRTIYFGDPTLRNGSPAVQQAFAELQGKLQSGGFHPNPARGLLVGALGLWRSGEPAHEPGDRALVPSTAPSLGSAFVRVGPAAVTVDLANSIPEIDPDLTKKDLGTLSLVAVDPGTNAETQLATFPYAAYQRSAYEASAGIVEAALPPQAFAAAQSANIELRAGDGSVLLAEMPLRAIPDMPNLYLDEGQTVNATVRVYERGAPVPVQTPVALYTMSADGGTIAHTDQLQTGANGVLSLPITGKTGEIVAYVAAADPSEPPPSNGINPQVHTYMYVRTLAADAAVAALPPTWDNVFAHVLANWNAMAPCMDNWLNLADPDQIKSYAAWIKSHTAPANFEGYTYMPVTRDLTAGQRALLYAYLDAPPEQPAAELLESAPRPVNFAELSKAMRGGPT